MEEGFIYILINQAMPGIVKIGKTKFTGYKRAKELSSHTGVPIKFEVGYQCLVSNCDIAEKIIHESLSKYRISNKREFFEITFQVAVKLVSEIIIDKNLCFNEKVILHSTNHSIENISNFYLELGLEKQSQEQYKAAIDLYDKALHFDPKNHKAQEKRLISIFESISFDNRSLEGFESFLSELIFYRENYPRSDKIYYIISTIFEIISDYRESGKLASQDLYDAKEHISIAIEIAPSNYLYFKQRGRINLDLSLTHEAELDFSWAIDLAPENPYNYESRGLFYEKIGNYKKAIEDFNKVIDLFPENRFKYKYFEKRGDLFFRYEKMLDALADYERAQEKCGYDSGEILIKISEIYRVQSKFNEAEKYILKALEKSPKYSVYWEKLGSIRISKNDFSNAIDAFINALDFSPYKEKYLLILNKLYSNNNYAIYFESNYSNRIQEIINNK